MFLFCDFSVMDIFTNLNYLPGSQTIVCFVDDFQHFLISHFLLRTGQSMYM